VCINPADRHGRKRPSAMSDRQPVNDSQSFIHLPVTGYWIPSLSVKENASHYPDSHLAMWPIGERYFGTAPII
jgi:hypothetical protein